MLAMWACDDPKAFADFRARWQKAKCALVVTQIHLMEMRRNRDPEIRRRRIDLFRQLAPIVSDLPNDPSVVDEPTLFVHRELLIALRNAQLLAGNGANVDEVLNRWCSIFRGVFNTPDQLAAFYVLEAQWFDTYLMWIESAMSTAALARTRPNESVYARTRLEDLPEERPSTEQLEVMRRTTRDALADENLWERLRGPLSPDQLDALKQIVSEYSEQIIDEIGRAGPKGALSNFLGIELTDTGERQYTDVLIQKYCFQESIKELLTKYVKSDVETVERLVQDIELATCPGTWIRCAIEIEMRRGKAAAEPGDEWDLEHIAYLPYVDLLTADRRTAAFSEQVLKRPGVPPNIGSVAPARRAGNLNELLTILAPFIQADH